MAVESVSLFGFQCHRRLEVALAPYLTVLVGSSDAGKSAIFRAIRLVAFNRPSGTAYIRHGDSRCRVDLHVDGQEISRRRSETTNEYRIGDQVFRALGTGIPDEVRSILNLSRVNFQCQHDPPFWLTTSPGETAKEMNEVVDLSLIDEVMSNLGIKAKRARTLVELTEDRLRKAVLDRDRLSWGLDADKELRTIEDKCSEMQQHTERTGSLRTLLEQSRASLRLAARSLPCEDLERIEGKRQVLAEHNRETTLLSRTIEQAHKGEVEACQSAIQAEAMEESIRQMMGQECLLCGQPIESPCT